MRSLHIIDNVPADRSSSRRRPRAPAVRMKEKSNAVANLSTPASTGAADPESYVERLLLVVESEGAVFDSLAHRHERGYLPAFSGCFAFGVDAPSCGELWRHLALESRLRGAEPLIILSAALKHLNSRFPSLRRVSVSRTLDVFLSSGARDLMSLASHPGGSPERLIVDWIVMADRLLEEEAYAPVFSAAAEFLSNRCTEFPKVEVLIHSTRPESEALNQWEMAGLGACFMRIAGKERGDLAGYLRTAMRNGYDSTPMLLVGTTVAAYQAAQSVGARFFPILPGSEESCWDELTQEYFPRFMLGQSACRSEGTQAFLRMLLMDSGAIRISSHPERLA